MKQTACPVSAFEDARISAKRHHLNLLASVSVMLVIFSSTEALHLGYLLAVWLLIVLEISKCANARLSISFALLCVLFSFLGMCTKTHALTEEEVKSWADHLSSDLRQFADSAMAFSKFKSLYDNVGYTTVDINPSEELGKVADKFAEFIKKKTELIDGFSKEVVKHYDQYLKSGLATSKVKRTFQNLPPSVYIDSDKLYKYNLPPEALEYSYDLGRYLLLSQSTVKIPDSLKQGSPRLVDVVNWTSNLDGFLKKSWESHQDVRHLYFGSNLGMLRIYPGISWVRDLIGFPHDYELRTQSWYASQKSGAKDIVIIVDGSLSMKKTGLKMAKDVKILLQTIGSQNKINAIVSASKVYNVKGGEMTNRTTSVLTCSEDRVVPATDYTRYEILKALIEVEASGGSDHLAAFQLAFKMLKRRKTGPHFAGENCPATIMFLTDGKELDGDVRCNKGTYRYMEDNSKKFSPGPVCHFHFDELMDMVTLLKISIAPTKVDIITFLTNDQEDPSDNGELLAGRLACANNGIMSRITDDNDYFTRMAPYFSYLETMEATHETFILSSHSTFGDQRSIIAITQHVSYGPSNRHLGVVSIDVLLSSVEFWFLNTLWADAHAFIAVLTDGSALIHPLKTRSYLLQPAYTGLYSFETEEGNPEEFSNVLKILLSKTSGSVKIKNNPGRTALDRGFTVLRPTTSSEYFIKQIEKTDFAIGVNVFEQTLKFRKLQQFNGTSITNYLHTLLAAKSHTETAQLITDLDPQITYNEKYPSIELGLKTKKHSVVAITPEGFCTMTNFEEQFSEAYLEFVKIQAAINSNIVNATTSCDVLRPDARQDLKITSAIEDAWLSRSADIVDSVSWVYFLTVNGIMRMFPGIALHYDELLSMQYQRWYESAVLHRGFLSFVPEQESPYHLEKVVTMTKALLRGDISCTEQTEKTCTELGLMAVVAVEIKAEKFFDRVMASLQSAAKDKEHLCGASYSCVHSGRKTKCKTECMLIDRSANFIMPRVFSKVFNRTETSLADKYPFILNHLMAIGVFRKRRKVVFPHRCVDAEDVVNYRFAKPIMDAFTEGPIPVYTMGLYCSKEEILFTDNRTRLIELGGVITSSLERDPCSNGEFFVALVNDTSSYLVVIDNYEDLSDNPFNYLCPLSLEALATRHDPIVMSIIQCQESTQETLEAERFSQACTSRAAMNMMSCGYACAKSLRFDSKVVIIVFVICLAFLDLQK